MVQAGRPREANGEKNGQPVATPFLKYRDKKNMLSSQMFEASNRSS